MKNRFPYYKLFLAISLILFIGCERGSSDIAPLPTNYEELFVEWNESRTDVLKGPTNWLRLVEIYWMEEGKNHFGSGADQDLVLPAGTIPEHAGTLTLDNGVVTLTVAEEVVMTHEGEPVREMMMYDGGERFRIEHGSLEWFIDNRGDTFGLKLYNKENEKADAFDGFPRYPLSPDWHLRASFVPNSDITTITVDNVIGEEVERFSPGNIKFRAGGQDHSLIAFEADSGFFVIFADETNRTETYNAGRYMIVPFPDDDGNTIIDFNKAFNPPCAFSKYTTCQLPPPQNRLDIAIPAGEKRPIDWDGI